MLAATVSLVTFGVKGCQDYNRRVADKALRDAKADEALKAFPTIQYDVDALKRESEWRRRRANLTPTPTE